MSGKRGATTDLNHDNWDQEEKVEEAGRFQVATEDEINRRVIKRAVRRTRPTEQDGPSQTRVDGSKIFAGLGFTAPTGSNAVKSFSFLVNSKTTEAGPDKVDRTSPSPWKSFIQPTDVGSTSKSNEPKTSIGKSTNIMPDTNGQPCCSKSLINPETPKTDAYVFPSSDKPSLLKMDFGPSESISKRNALVPNINPPLPSIKLDSTSGTANFQTYLLKSVPNVSKSTSMEMVNVSADSLNKPIFSALGMHATAQQPKFPSTTANVGLGNGNSKPKSFSAFECAADLKFGPSSAATSSFADGKNALSVATGFSGDKINNVSAPNKTGRSAIFLQDLADINTGFVQWVQDHLAEDRTSILTRCFADYITHVQALFNEEKKLDLTQSECQLLKKQENVLNEIMVSKNAAKKVTPLNDGNNGDMPSLLLPLTSQPDETLSFDASRVPSSTARYQECITISVNGAADMDAVATGTDEPPPTVRYCKIPPDAPEIQVIFYSEKPLKVSRTKEFQLNIKESASFTDETCESFATEMPKPLSTEKPFSYATMSANSNAIDKTCSTNLTANSNATEKPSLFGTMAMSRASVKPFSFGTMATSSVSVKPFALNMTTVFSSPAEKPFSFANVTVTPSTTTTAAKEDEAEDEPPKVEFTQVVEEGSIYSKRCKVFVRKDDSKEYQDRGVGTLFLKPVGTTGKTQLIVRANTSLGNLLMNTLLSPDMPIQKITSKAANTVMLMCIPTPEAKPPPRSVLLRVKTSPDADELIEKLNENK